MTWLELRDWAYREDQRLREAGYWEGIDWPPKHSIGLWLKRTDTAVTQSVEHFLATGEWGELARDDRAGLFYRIAWATQILAVLTHPNAEDVIIVPNPTADAATVRRWVLIEMWDLVGRSTVANYARWGRLNPGELDNAGREGQAKFNHLGKAEKSHSPHVDPLPPSL